METNKPANHTEVISFGALLDPVHFGIDIFSDPLTVDVWNEKYLLPEEKGDIQKGIDRCVAGIFANDPNIVARANTASAIQAGLFLPAGRILAGAGTSKMVTLMNCYVSGTIDDAMEGIMEAVKRAAMTLQQGGGIGYDFTPIRPKKAYLKRLGPGSEASGPVSFMLVFDSMCATVMSAGARRGAMMGCLEVNHPDIEDFITAKQTKGVLTNFNVSVLITDDFMKAVKDDATWDLVHTAMPGNMSDNSRGFYQRTDGMYIWKTVRARELWDKILQGTYEYAEPGVIFIDQVNRMNNLQYLEEIRATNPCGEQPLPPHGCCLLGAINLARLVRSPFSASAQFDFGTLSKVVATAVRALDNVIDVTNYPLIEQGLEEDAKRRIGLGITGLGDALAMLGIKYGQIDAVELTQHIMQSIRDVAYQTSAGLAIERGAFPGYTCEYLKQPFIKSLPTDIQYGIDQYGIRNSLLLTIAPVGTTSIAFGNMSSGCEPIFSHSMTRMVLQSDGSRKPYESHGYAKRVYEVIYRTGGFQYGYSQIADAAMVTTKDLRVIDHLNMQAACQKYVDAAISKTINCPIDMPYEQFKDVYMVAWEFGLKGCTTYRPSGTRGAVLIDTSAPEQKPTETAPKDTTAAESPLAARNWEPQLIKRPTELIGRTYKIRWPHWEAAIYMTINDHDGHPYEMFLWTKTFQNHAWTVALTRLISAIMRQGFDMDFIIEELKEVQDPHDFAWIPGPDGKSKKYGSPLALIAEKIEYHIYNAPKGHRGELYDDDEEERYDDTSALLSLWEKEAASAGSPSQIKGAASVPDSVMDTSMYSVCSKCGEKAAIKEEGCMKCLNCGASSCY